ncbi:MAG: hypothetical protein M0026_12280 [Nocardiopsaceae bacterium]|nr:hypothetical protein [Nocardiopsaceae bacterium]
MTGTDVFFQEWGRRRPGERRNLARAADLMRELDISPAELPVIGVVGSKGKGTTATYASACLAAAGLDVVTVTGPSYRSHRERIRFNGAAIDEEGLSGHAAAIDAARSRLPAPEGGYLGPSGLFLIAGLLEARRRGADVCVLEAGMGGRGDELRLAAPRVVALASVFAEHIGILGDTVADIAQEKASVAGDSTEAFVHLPQTPPVQAVVESTVREATAGRVRPEEVHAVPDSPGPVPPGLRPAGLSADSADLGCAAAGALLRCLGRAPGTRTHEVLSTVRLPGRLSAHRVAETELIVDSAINGTGVRAAVRHARQRWPRIDRVLICLPDHKDVGGAARELGSLPVTAATLPESHLRFTRALPGHWDRVEADRLTRDGLTGMGSYVLVLGTVYFTGRVLDLIGADTERLFSAEGAA